VLAFLRKGKGADDIVLVACNFTPVPRYHYRVGVPRGGRWRDATPLAIVIFKPGSRTLNVGSAG
jgi:1,4-alpha-glucan branching enzyme